MEIKINNILELNLVNEDVNSFIELFSALKNSININKTKVGFKKSGRLDLLLDEETIAFVMSLCETAGIQTETEIN